MVTQRLMLEREGVTFKRGRVDLARHGWSDGRGRGASKADRKGSHATSRRAAPLARAGRMRLRVDDERAWGR